MRYIGIDPGLDGAIAVIEEGSQLVYDMPVYKDKTKRFVDEDELVALLKNLICPGDFVTMEKVHAMKGQGVSSCFNFGCGYGTIRGVLAALNVSRQYVTPQAWKKEMIAGENKEKAVSLIVAKRLFPAMCSMLSRVKDDGRAEALLMAEFGRRVLSRKAA